MLFRSGLAVGARPSLLFGGVVLFGPVALGWAEGGPARRRLLAAACGPVVAVGLGLMAYNQLRFGSPFEFGQTYQLAGERQDRLHFSLAPLWFNLRAYFLAPAELGGGFPFVEPARLGAPPAGHGGVETPFGTLAMIPFTWLALALPFAWLGIFFLLPFLLVQAVWGFSLLEVVNYLEHYGLCRRKLPNGRYERCQPQHSWNSNNVASNVFLYHLQRHSDHHAHPLRRYQALRH